MHHIPGGVSGSLSKQRDVVGKGDLDPAQQQSTGSGIQEKDRSHQTVERESEGASMVAWRSGDGGGVRTPPPNDTWHAFLSGSAPFGFPPKETRGALLLFGLPQGEAHDTRKHHIRMIVISHPDDRHILSGYVCPDH